MKRLFSIENLTVIGIVLGVLVGYYLPEFAYGIKFLGDAFLDILKAIAIPLIFVSVFVSIASLSSISDLKNMGGKAIAYYFLTTALAVFTGIVVVNLIGFGDSVSVQKNSGEVVKHTFTIKSFI